MTLRLHPDEFLQAATLLRHGGTVALPTETVYGLGADATNATAIAAVFAAKGRPSDNPLIIHLRYPEQLLDFCRAIPSLANQLIEAFCPGPLTLVLPKRASIVDGVTAGLNTVAVRFPSHPTAQRILHEVGLPIAAPSANLSGRPSATTWQAVIEDLDDRIDAVVCDRPTDIGLESTVIDLTSTIPMVLRCGSITLEQLRTIEPSIELRSNSDSLAANSPGLRHRHYQPRANVALCDSPDQIDPRQRERTAYIGLLAAIASPPLSSYRQCRDLDEYARTLFDFFRECDAANIETIWCQRIPEIGIGRAIMDRLRRASGER